MLHTRLSFSVALAVICLLSQESSGRSLYTNEANVAYASNYAYPAIPIPDPLPVVGGANQYHAQSELGEYNYGYANEDSAKSEVKTADGIVRGSYSYVDAKGELQKANYVSDALGFRVAATNIPVHVAEAVPAPVEAPVVAAKPEEEVIVAKQALPVVEKVV